MMTNDKSSPLTWHLAEMFAVFCKLSFVKGEGRGFQRSCGLAGVLDLRINQGQKNKKLNWKISRLELIFNLLGRSDHL
jgi:hypothetical protein